jgi:hypothetical protein
VSLISSYSPGHLDRHRPAHSPFSVFLDSRLSACPFVAYSVLNMKSFIGAVALMLGVLAPSVIAAPPGTPAQRDLLVPLEERQDTARPPRQASCHTPSNRACWTTGFDINTDYEISTPNTGRVRPVRSFFSSSKSLSLRQTVHSHSDRGRQLDRSRWRCQEQGDADQWYVMSFPHAKIPER